MVKRYKIVKVEEDVHQNLVRLQALRAIRDGVRVTLSDLIGEMIERQPVYQISYEELKGKVVKK